MMWSVSHRADPSAVRLADRHYSRQKHGTPQFVPPGRCVVFTAPSAVWVTSWPFAEFTKHAWAGAWVNTMFRREPDCPHLASDMIRAAISATRYYWTPPQLGMVTFIHTTKVKRKRDWGRCYLKAGFKRVGTTKSGLVALQMTPESMPEPAPPLDALLRLELGA